MGRPIKSKYFGTTKGAGIGGEGISVITLGTAPVSTQSITVVIGSPTVPGGVQAVATANKTGNTVTSVTVDTAGTGYVSAPAISFTGSNMTTVGDATATLLTSVSDVIAVTAFIPVADGGSAALTGDIQEQVASKKYRVRTSEGTGPCKLVTTSSIAAGEMYMMATDQNGSTYFVKKLTAHRAILVQDTVNGSFEFNTNEAAGWTLDAAATGIVVIDNR